MAEVFSILLSAFGIGLVIFVHEFGHYLAARICGVRVLTFSLGFGPRLIGWQRGPTVYQVALVPFGGYCRMSGEEGRFDGSEPAPHDLLAKSVGQRFFIYSGGVLMNVVFALVVFPILFQVGVPFIRPVLGTPDPGGPAWEVGLPEGTQVLEVNGTEMLDFMHVHTEIALADPGDVELLVREPGESGPRKVHLVPRRNEELGIQMIEVREPLKRDEEGRPFLDPVAGSPAEKAGLRKGDRLVRILGVPPGLDLRTAMAVALRNEGPLELVVTDGEDERQLTIPLAEEGQSSPRVGIQPVTNHVVDLRPNPALRELGLQKDDRILEAQGHPVLRTGDLNTLLAESREPLDLRVRRDGEELELRGPALDRDQALDLVSRIALVPDVEGTTIQVTEGEPAARAGLVDGDRIVRVDGTEVELWADVPELVRRAAVQDRAAVFTIARTGPEGPALLEISARPEPQPFLVHGANVLPDEYVYRTAGVLDSIQVGALCSWQFLEHSWLTVKRMLQRQVSADNLGGIISIGAISYTLAESGWEKLFFFLCILSINLAFLNVLPIPVLDGGHLFFLIVEKLKGSPVSARVWSYSQMVGVILILFLMVYVTYNDLVRWVFDG